MATCTDSKLKIALAQIAPVLLNKEATLLKVKKSIRDAGEQKCDLIVFGEALVPGYPHWLYIIGAAGSDSPKHKEIHAHYIRNAVQIEEGDLDEVCCLARDLKIAVYLGVVERAKNRGGHSLYCSLVYVDACGTIQSVHRKLQPTYNERMSWSPGDGHGFQVHKLKQFTVGGLNCWENWMPLSRTALYGLGEDLHVAVWPGSVRNTTDITRFIALEARSFVVSASSLMRVEDIPPEFPHRELLIAELASSAVISDGGSCIAGPDGKWVIEPVANKEGLFVAEIDFGRVLEERTNFDPVGHYSRPDITHLVVNRDRQQLVHFK